MSLKPAADNTERDAWLARSRTAWDERAAGWDAMLGERPDLLREELEQTIVALALQPGMRVLDAGCGTGQWAVGMAAYGCRVTAIDLAPEMLRRTRANTEEAGVTLDLREGDISHLADDDDTFDAVHCRCALQFTPDPAGVLREFARVLRPAGRIFLSVPGALSPIYGDAWRRFINPATFNTRMVPWELEALLDHLGWQVLDGWGVFGPAGNQRDNPFSENTVTSLPCPLKQAAATFWCTIAARE